MCIGANLDGNPQVARRSKMAPVEIHAMRIAIQLQNRLVFRGLLDHCSDIHSVAIA